MNQTGGVQVERLDAIRSHLYAQGFSSIQELADAVGASLATIRRDLRVLETEGAIDRVHGGARIAEGSSVEMAFQERAKRNLAAKRAIGTAAYELLAPHASVFLDAGTTVLQLARLIRVNPLPLRIFTNGLAVAHEFLNVPSLEVSLLGGQVRSENASTVGPQAEEVILDFGIMAQDPQKPEQLVMDISTKIYLSQFAAKKLALTLSQAIQRLEQQFGAIELDPRRRVKQG